ncbi:hypothetical protein T08_1160 [Trichinella sp. T8]|nr:hypothetical protein T08_1160 [Trichinella sp. T8]
MSKIRQDRRSQLIPYQHIVHIYTHSDELITFKHLVEKNLPLNIVKLLLNFFSNKVMEGEEVDYEGTLVENKRIEIKPQLRLKLTRSVKSDERAKLLGSLAEQMKKRDNDSTAQLLPPPFFSSDASNFFVIVHKVTE